jgi:hypothetical protein
MLISSKFRDYYDCVLSYGVDKAIVYDRSTSEVKINRAGLVYSRKKDLPLLPDRRGMTVRGSKVWLSFRVVGFCGNLFPVIEMESEGTNLFFYDLKMLRRHIGTKNEGRYSWYCSYDPRSDSDMEIFFNPATWRHLVSAFQEHKVPVFEFKRWNEHRSDLLVLNPQLKPLGFVKVKDPATAFQELYMFITGVLGAAERPTVKVSDKVLAAKKGHGGKYSFRKPPKERGK